MVEAEAVEKEVAGLVEEKLVLERLIHPQQKLSLGFLFLD
jgi:hypothetical protein